MRMRFSHIAPLIAVVALAVGTCAHAKVTLKLMTHTHSPFNTWVINKIKEYSKIKPGVVVNYSHMGHDEFDQKIFVTLASGSAPDIMNVYYPTFTDLVRGNFLDQPPATITQDIKANFIQPAWSGMVVGGKLWGYPTEAIMLLPVANVEFFKVAGIPAPTSYDELLQFQRKMTLKDSAGKLQRIGVSLSTSGLWSMLHWSAHMRSYGGEILNPDLTKAVFNTPDMAKALGYYRELAPTVIPAGGFEKNKVGIVITGPYSRPSWKISAKSLEVKALPALKGVDGKKIGTSYHWGFVVTKSSKRKNEAWEFVKWLNSPANKLDLTKAVEYPPTTRYEMEHYKEDAWMKTFADEFEFGKPLPAVRRWKLVETAVCTWISKFISSKTLGPEQALKAAEQETNIILKRNTQK